jgi:hypothetical protein
VNPVNQARRGRQPAADAGHRRIQKFETPDPWGPI